MARKKKAEAEQGAVSGSLKEKSEEEPQKSGDSESEDAILKSQPVLNIGMVGHVDHGKTTLLERLSGKWTDTHSEEIKKGITIRLGYADVVFRQCRACNFFTSKESCPGCKSKDLKPLRKASFVDAPGHESLMATMLAGATIMDGALLLVAANEECPQPQTREHLMALEIVGVEHIVVVQNKIDLVNEEQALKNCNQIKSLLKGTRYENAPIIPISAQHSIGLTHLIEAIQTTIPTPLRDSDKAPLMLVARSFDINRPGTRPKDLVGGVLGGSLKQGQLKQGQDIEIRPGYMVEEKNQKIWKPLFTKIIALKTGGYDTDSVGPAGSIGILISLDPSIVKGDKLAGSMIGPLGKLPKVWYDLFLEIHLLQRVVGVKEELNVEPIKLNEALMLNVNAAATVGFVTKLKKDHVYCKLKLPVCADAGSRVTISRRVGTRFRLIGYGIIKELAEKT